MGILYLTIVMSICLGAVFLTFFIISARSGQFNDDESPAVRMLKDDSPVTETPKEENQTQL